MRYNEWEWVHRESSTTAYTDNQTIPVHNDRVECNDDWLSNNGAHGHKSILPYTIFTQLEIAIPYTYLNLTPGSAAIDGGRAIARSRGTKLNRVNIPSISMWNEIPRCSWGTPKGWVPFIIGCIGGFPQIQLCSSSGLENGGKCRKQKGSLRGPKRAIRLCVLGILMPALFISVPLYLR